MKKTNELMRGDLVLVSDGERMNVRKIESIARKKIGYHKSDGETRMWHVHYNAIKPIPLTEEILKANGFESLDDWPEMYRINSNIYYNMEHEVMCYMVNGLGWSIFDVDYVHEFQHALRMIGLKNKADNFNLE